RGARALRLLRLHDAPLLQQPSEAVGYRAGHADLPVRTRMKLIRSWPDPLPAGRNYVVDDAPRMLNSNYSYAGLVDVGDDLIQLDWDTAVSREDLTAFAALAREHPDRVLVAPVPVYADSRRGLDRTVWNLRRYTAGETYLRY